MAGRINLSEEELPDEDKGFSLKGPDVMKTFAYLCRIRDRIRKGLDSMEEYNSFIEEYQMDLLMFFVIGWEEIKEGLREELADKLVKESIHADPEYNEMCLIDTLNQKQILEISRHYDLDLIIESSGNKSISDIRELRNKMVHDPDEFAEDTPSPEDLVDYINSTLDIVEFLEDEG